MSTLKQRIIEQIEAGKKDAIAEVENKICEMAREGHDSVQYSIYSFSLMMRLELMDHLADEGLSVKIKDDYMIISWDKILEELIAEKHADELQQDI